MKGIIRQEISLLGINYYKLNQKHPYYLIIYLFFQGHYVCFAIISYCHYSFV